MTACLVQPCVATRVNYITQRRKCCLLPVPPLSPATLDMTFCLWKPLPHLPPQSSPPQLIARLSHLGIARNVPRKPRRSTRGGKNEWRKVKVIVGFHDRLPSIILPALQPPGLSLPSLTFTISVQLFSLTLTSVNTTPLLYHLPLHPTHSLSAVSMQEPSALPGGGPTYPPSFRTTTST